MASKRRPQKASKRRPKPKAKAKPRPTRRRARVAPVDGNDIALGERRGDAGTNTKPPLIAGIGASAGGLEAFSQVLECLPPHPGLAIVLVQHLAPQHESALPGLLSGRTQMEVVQATDGMAVECDRVYVIPPNVQMGISDDVLHLSPRPRDRTQYTPIDYFLHTLAESAQDRALRDGHAADGLDVAQTGGPVASATRGASKPASSSIS